MSARGGSLRWLAEVFWLIVLTFLALSVQVAPIGLTPAAWPSPDLMLCLIVYFCLHLPGATPIAVVFALAVLRDFVVAGPVGPGVITILLASEVIKARRAAILKRRLVWEWPVMALCVFAVLVTEWLFLLVSLAHGPALIELGPRWLATVLAYPALVLVLGYLLGLRARTPVPARYG